MRHGKPGEVSMRLLAIIAVILASVVLAVQNASTVVMQFFFWRGEASLALLATLCFAAGALVSLLASLPSIYRMRANEPLLRARIELLEKADGSPVPPATPSGATPSDFSSR